MARRGPRPRGQSAARPGVRGPRLSLSRQVADRLRRAVLQGQLRPGTRVPSTRALAGEWSLARNTVLDAYAQLVSEGYLDTRVGRGTFVSPALSEDALGPAGRARSPGGHDRPRVSRLSGRGRAIAASYASVADDRLRPFTPGIPALNPELFAAWWRLSRRRQRAVAADGLNYGPSTGYRPLQEAIAAHLGPARGVRCRAEQVILTAGTQAALALAGHVLLDPGDPVWVEDPGYAGARGALLASGATVVPVPVDEDGILMDAAIAQGPEARLAYVSPSHQYPLGVTMSLSRRLQLLEWAARSGAWILEDDYDAEFRYAGRPVPALQGLDPIGRVLYLGTFSKALFPALRLGYMVVPEDLVDPFGRAIAVLGHRTPTLDQMVLTDFIAEGHFARHLGRMRRRYAHARGVLERDIRRLVGSALTITGAPTGMHVLGRLAKGVNDRVVAGRAAEVGICAPPVSEYAIGKPRLSGLVLGYGHLTDRAIRVGVEGLARALG
jgi:GntR family transcriptional regulator/MocR family aminotransferase